MSLLPTQDVIRVLARAIPTVACATLISQGVLPQRVLVSDRLIGILTSDDYARLISETTATKSNGRSEIRSAAA